MRMTRDELEYAISQYLDGHLKPLEKAALEEHLAVDAEARALLEEYRKLDAALKGSAKAAPAIAWDRFADEIRTSLAAEETPIRNYSFRAGLRSMTWAGRLAIAASILFVISVAVHFAPTGRQASQPSVPSGLAVISGPQAQQPEGPVTAEISIGPSPNLAGNFHPAADQDVVARPSVVLIDRAIPAGQDSDPNMY